MGPILLGACALTVARGTLVGGLSSTGYKLMRRVPHNAKGLRLGSNGQETWIDRRTPRNAARLVRRSDPHHHCGSARAIAVNPSRLRRDPPGFGGLLLARPSRGASVGIQSTRTLP